MRERKILLVDDEVPILRMLEEAFQMEGYEVLTAESAEKALELLARESVMVMFLDLKLPGMSGIDLCRQIRKENQFAVIYALTGYSNFFGLLECRAAGFDDFFLKPVGLEVLYKAAGDAFEKVERWNIFGCSRT
ncbi:MAG: response regulator [Deltaproteobacteria bacterium]|nr:response regulator [Deltaproteobacteria bacterium]